MQEKLILFFVLTQEAQELIHCFMHKKLLQTQHHQKKRVNVLVQIEK